MPLGEVRPGGESGAVTMKIRQESPGPKSHNGIASDGDGQGLTADEFDTAATKLVEVGHHPLAIGKKHGDKLGGKAPWHSGVTGYNGVDAYRDQVMGWAANVASRIGGGERGVLNLGLRMSVGGIGIDVDAYDGKRGLDTIAECEARHGSLPPTYRVTARPYAQGSGIRLYRVPDDWHGETVLKTVDGANGHVELIQWWHRLAAVPPSYHHTGSRYRVYDERTGNELLEGTVPPLDDWPKLPDAWLEALRTEPAKAAGGEATDAEVDAFAAEYIRAEQPWHLVEFIVPKVRSAITDTRDAAFDALHEAARTARVGWCSWTTAVAKIEGAARDSYEARDASLDEADFARSVKAAVRAANTEDIDQLEARYAKRLADEQAKQRQVDDWAPILMEAEPASAEGRPVTRLLSGVVPAKVRWLWRPWLPLGKVSILEGDPDVGKSMLTLSIAALVSTGRAWPETQIDDEPVPQAEAEAAGVVLVGVEDDVIRPGMSGGSLI